MTAAELTNGGSWCARCVQEHATCTNTFPAWTNAYTCSCNAGYANTAADGGAVVCGDIDECAVATCPVLPLPKRNV